MVYQGSEEASMEVDHRLTTLYICSCMMNIIIPLMEAEEPKEEEVFTPEALASIRRSESQFVEGRYRKIKSLKELSH